MTQTKTYITKKEQGSGEREDWQMKAIVCTKYGPPDVLKLEESQKPTPGDDEILVEVHAASVTSSNLILVRGKPFVARLGFRTSQTKAQDTRQ